jgi:TM2 domain-containing membrane protein YozV
LALICAIVFPGLGALYNGQPIKALLQFLTMLGLLTMVDLLSSPLDNIFGLGLIACYLTTILDSYRSAWRSRVERGSLQAEDEHLRERIQQHPQTIGILLISLGILALLEHLAPTLLERFWPLLFIAAGYAWISRSNGTKRHPGSSSR